MLFLNLIPIFMVLMADLYAVAFVNSVLPKKVTTSCGHAVLNECWCLDEDGCPNDDDDDDSNYEEDAIFIIDQKNLLTADRVKANISPEYPVELNMVGAEVDAIEGNAFDNFVNLKSINLEQNRIVRLLPNVFTKLANLEFLSLKDNGLEGTKNAFAGLSNLKKLDISNNPLTEVLEDNCFFGIPKTCDILIRSDNGVKSIGTDAFGIESSAYDEGYTGSYEDIKLKTIHTRSAPSDYFDFGYRRRVQFEICIDNSRVQRVDVLKEDNATSGCKIFKSTFSTLLLGNMGISAFEKGWYQLQDKSKISTRLSSIHLGNNKITRVTKDLVNDLPPYITWLDLSANKIERLDKGTFEHLYIFSVELNNNLIEEIEGDTFKMPRLSQLFLRENRLKNTKFVGTLSPNLVSLHMDYNEITEISPNSFSHLKNLRYLNLDHNRITKLQNQCLLGVKNLGSLILSRNAIATIEKNAFEGLDPVVLHLGDNYITSIEREIFNGFEKLQTLNVASNQLTEMRNTTFDLPKLKTLELNNNYITAIEKGAARKLGGLQKLDISNNPIEKLENGALFGLSKSPKSYIRVVNTPIRLIQGGVFDSV